MRSTVVFSDLTLPSGPAPYEDVCEIHRLVSSILTDDLKKIEEGTYEGNQDEKVRTVNVAVRFLRNNKITPEQKSPAQMAGILDSLELPTFRDEIKA